MIYLDTSALVKLLHAEPESQALRDWLADRRDIGWTSSTILEVESFRVLARHAPALIADLHVLLDQVELVDLDSAVRVLARTVRPETVRSLDAIHLATALLMHDEIASFVTYDKRLAKAAAANGLTADMPT